uniref:Pericentriolar material 1 protein n=1 Tax=Globodera rostochiensis TaxID=31243 RepID=A0A914GUM0_GLORO
MDSNQKSRADFDGLATQNKLSLVRELIDRIDKGDLVARQRLVIDRLSTIRVGKSKILNHLQILKGKEESGEYSNRELVGKLIESYDGLMAQEKEFIALMRDIIKSYHEAIDAVSSELNSLQNPQQSAELKVMEDGEEQKQLENSVSVQLDGLVNGFTSLENMVGEMEKTSLMDEQFKTCIELHYEQKRKMELMHQIHMQEKAALELSTKELSDQAKGRVVNERSNLDRKQRQLERLRREAERRGLLRGGNTSAPHQNGKQRRQQQKHSPEASVEPVIAENERIPSLPSLPILTTSTDNSAGKKKDELRTKISERFSSLEARKQRMRLIRIKLNDLEKNKMDNAYDEAVKRVHCLDEMRIKLEHLKLDLDNNEAEEEAEGKAPAEDGISGDKLPVLRAQNSAEEGLFSAENDGNDENHASISTEKLIAQVRQAFSTTINKFFNATEFYALSEAFPVDRFECAVLALVDRLKMVENTLSTHSDQLTWIGDQGPSSSSASVEKENVGRFVNNEVARIVSVLAQFLDGKFALDKMKPIDEEVGSRMVEIVVVESSLLYPAEYDDEIRHNFSIIFGGLVSQFYGKNYAEVEVKLMAQLEETVHSELLFLRLIRSANAVTSTGQRDESK